MAINNVKQAFGPISAGKPITPGPTRSAIGQALMNNAMQNNNIMTPTAAVSNAAQQVIGAYLTKKGQEQEAEQKSAERMARLEDIKRFSQATTFPGQAQPLPEGMQGPAMPSQSTMMAQAIQGAQSPETAQMGMQLMQSMKPTPADIDVRPVTDPRDGSQRLARFDPQGNMVGFVPGATPPAKSPLVNVDTGDKGSNTGFKALQEGAGKQIATISEKANQGVENLQTVANLRRDLEQLQGSAFSTGEFAKVAQRAGNLFMALGGDKGAAAEIAASENIEALSNKMQFMETQILKGAISDKEQETAGRINTRLEKTGLGNLYATNRMEALAHASIIWDELNGQTMEDNPEWGPDKVLRHTRKRMQAMPYVSERAVDQNGAPVFFPTFYSTARRRDPSVTLSEAQDAWKLFEQESNRGQ